MNKVSTFAVGAAFGCAFGALAALALAPQSGTQTREMAAERVGAFAEDAQDFNAGLMTYVKSAAGDADDLRVGAASAAKQAVRKAMNRGAAAGQETSQEAVQPAADELRAKIEEARERIAALAAEDVEQAAGE